MLTELHKRIFNLAYPYLRCGRWWDLAHTKLAISHMQRILNGQSEQTLTSILIPTIILHDIGWAKLGKTKNITWNASHMRIEHMQAGAEIAREILEEVAAPHIEEIVALIATHDNVYLGIKPETRTEILLRDCDACFIHTYISFWKDYYVQGNGMLPSDFLTQQVEKHGKRYTAVAQAITDEEIASRCEEIQLAEKSSQEHFSAAYTMAAG